MNREKYMAQRASLLAEMKGFIEEGKMEDYAAKVKEVEALDKQWDEVSLANANVKALEDKTKAIDLENKGVTVQMAKVIDTTNNVADDNIYNSIEYRKAFMNYVVNGTPIPAQFNIDANTATTDIGSVIPNTILDKIIEKMEATGMILPLLTKTSYKGGLSIPLSSVKPVATWVAEGGTSDKQKKPTGEVVFSYYKLRCAVSMSFETSVVALGAFEIAITNNIAEAMNKALEQAVISGTGIGQPKGILTETVVVGQNVDIAAAGDVAYATLVDAEAALPLEYENDAVWGMTKKTFMKFIGMVDSQKQPIARVNYGIAGKPERTLLGRPVVLNNYMTSLGATIAADTVVAFLFNFKDYVLNTNYNVTVKKYEDNDTDDQVTKAIMLVDGKVVDKNSLVTVTKKFA